MRPPACLLACEMGMDPAPGQLKAVIDLFLLLPKLHMLFKHNRGSIEHCDFDSYDMEHASSWTMYVLTA